MHPDTWDARKAVKLLNDDRMAEALAVELRAHEVQDAGDVDDETQTVDELRVSVFGTGHSDHVIWELNEQIMEMTRPQGVVYEKLADHGSPLSLCTTKVSRKLIDSDNGVEYITTKTGRFASKDDSVVAGYRLEPEFRRLQKSMERISARVAEDISRIPALATHVPAMIGRTHQVMQRQLPAPAPPKGSK